MSRHRWKHDTKRSAHRAGTVCAAESVFEGFNATSSRSKESVHGICWMFGIALHAVLYKGSPSGFAWFCPEKGLAFLNMSKNACRPCSCQMFGTLRASAYSNRIRVIGWASASERA